MTRYITLWRKAPPDSVLDWDFCSSENIDDVKQVIDNLKSRGVHQFATYPIGVRIPELSSEC